MMAAWPKTMANTKPKRDGVHRGVVQRAGRAEAAGESAERAGAEPDVAA